MRFLPFVLLLVYVQAALSQGSTGFESLCTEATFTVPGLELTGADYEVAGTYGFCQVRGEIERRVSPVDGQNYAIGFELRLPSHWNGRFLFQGNGGTDGRVLPATGASANREASALDDGFAIISTDTGHAGGAGFGLDPLARVNYGYRANELLTPIAKILIENYYNRAPDYSYFAGCSNGGRHAMVAASRLADQFDGFLAGNPGFNLPKAAVQHAWDVQALSSLSDDLASSLSRDDMHLVAGSVLQACDALDGLADGMVQDIAGCQTVYEPSSLQCGADSDAECLSAGKLRVIDRLFSGPVDAAGNRLYSDWAYDAGISGEDWRRWKVEGPIAGLPMIATLGAGALASVFSTPPVATAPGPAGMLAFLRAYDFDRDAPSIHATTELYTESAMSFMTPPGAAALSGLADGDSRLIVYHGASDGVFSVSDTITWYEALDDAHAGEAAEFARLFVVPGMNHCAGGPATDRFDLLSALVDWVENGVAPNRVVATVNADNPELPADWSRQRSRPLCAYPQVAAYESGDTEDAASFVCRNPE